MSDGMKPRDVVDRLRSAMWWCLGLAPAVVACFAPRSEWSGESLLMHAGFGGGNPESLASAVNLSLNLLLLGIAGLLTLRALPRLSLLGLQIGPLALLLAALAMTLGLVGGPGTSTPSGSLLWPAVVLAVLVAGGGRPEEHLVRVRRIMLVLVYGSLAAAVVAPGWAMQPDYDIGLIPGLTRRLYGITGHANQLGLAGFAALVLCLHAPDRGRLRWVHLAAATLVVILAQSKSFFLLAPAALGIRFALRHVAQRQDTSQTFLMAGLLGLVAVGGILALLTLGGDRIGPGDSGRDTYQARTVIWDATIREWEERPLLGYGPCLWDRPMAERLEPELGFLVGGHSHNQLVQVLGQSGLVGMLCFAVFLAWTLRRGLVLARVGDGLALSLVAALAVRGSIEPFFYPQILDVGALFFLAVIAWLMAASSDPPQEPATSS